MSVEVFVTISDTDKIISESVHTDNIISSPNLKYIAARNGKSIEILYNPDHAEDDVKIGINSRKVLNIYDLIKEKKLSHKFYKLVDIYENKLILELEIDNNIRRG